LISERSTWSTFISWNAVADAKIGCKLAILEHVSTQTLAGDFNMQQGIVRSDVWIQLETNHYLKQGQCLFSLTTVLICTNGSIVANDIWRNRSPFSHALMAAL
jgi:hypothetical protein